MALNSVMITINDIFDDLIHENNRLLNELLFANKYINALNALKTHFIDIYDKCKDIITDEDKHTMNALMSELSTIQETEEVSQTKQLMASKSDLNVNKRLELEPTINGQNVIQLPRVILRPSLPSGNQSVGDVRKDNALSSETLKMSAIKVDDNQPLIVNKLKTRSQTKSNTKCLKNNENNNTNVVPKAANSGSNGESSEAAHKCPLVGCGKAFSTESRLEIHAKRHVKGKPLACDYENCDSVFAYEYRLLEHKKVHERRNRLWQTYDQCFDAITESYNCCHKECAKRFDTRKQLVYHMRAVHTDQRLVCDHDGCHKAFKTAGNLGRHRLTHDPSRDKPYACPDCYYKTAFKEHLGEHMAKHRTDGQLRVCPHDGCGKSYRRYASLRLHTIAAHTVRRKAFVCRHPNCGRNYYNRTQLRLHSAKHCAEPTLRCRREDCPEIFSSSSALNRHIKSVHNKTPPSVPKKYVCEWPGCEYKATKSTLNRHRDAHTGLKSYACDWPECGKRFRSLSSLKDHKNIHTNTKPYACHWPGCAYRCVHSGNLHKHVRHRHQKH